MNIQAQLEAIARGFAVELVTAIAAAPVAELDLFAADVATCRLCGCTDDHACDGGCSWVEADLCSACVPREIEPAKKERTHARTHARASGVPRGWRSRPARSLRQRGSFRRSSPAAVLVTTRRSSHAG